MILDILERLLKVFPGTLTVQKILIIDVDEEFPLDLYNCILEDIILKFDDHFPVMNGEVCQQVLRLFVVENSDFFEIALIKILEKIKSIQMKHRATLVTVLENLLNGEGFFANTSSYIIESYEFDSSHRFNKRRQWNEVIRSLISVPSKTANAMNGQVQEFFLSKNYIGFLFFNLLKIIEFLSDLTQLEKSRVCFDNLSMFLSKILTGFNDQSREKMLEEFINILAILTHKKSCKTKKYRKIIWKLLENLEKPGVEVIGRALLTKINPDKFHLPSIIGQRLMKNANWTFFFCTRIPLFVLVPDNEYLMKNLVVYLTNASRSHFLKMVGNLIQAWSTKSSVNYTSVEHQLYISKLIIVSFNSIKKIPLDAEDLKSFEEAIYLGLPIHLECSIEVLRAMGMKTGQIMLTILNRNIKRSEDIELNFDFNNFKEETKKILRDLDNLAEVDMKIYNTEKKIEEDIVSHIGSLIVKKPVQPSIYLPPERKFRPRMENKCLNNEVIAPTIQKRRYNIRILNSAPEPDSDDDLIYHDIVNVPDKVDNKSPLYLRDLRDGLLEVQDPERFNLSLENCEKIVQLQLADDDPTIGIEILEILITLEPKFHNDNFENLVFKNCVAITCVYPSICAEYLSRKFHAPIGTYAICHRILMLNVIAEAAKNLSSLKKEIKEKKINIKCSKQDMNNLQKAREIIEKRLQAKTRYFGSLKRGKTGNVNIFCDSAASFFFPLIYGFNSNVLLCENPLNDSDFIVLIAFLQTLGSIICSSQNCPIIPKMAKEALKLAWYLRTHKEPKVRIMTITLIATVLINVPENTLMMDFLDEILKIKLWLFGVLCSNVDVGEANTECRTIATFCMNLLNSVIKFESNYENDR